MSEFRRRLAQALIRACCRLLPPSRVEWGAAMAAELRSLSDDRAALEFARGCFWAACKEGMLKMELARTRAGATLLLGMAAMVVLSVNSAWQTAASDGSTGVIFALIATAFASSLLWGLCRGSSALVQAASTMLFLNLVAFLWLHSEELAGTAWANLPLYRALTLEGLLIWSLLLAGGLYLSKNRSARA